MRFAERSGRPPRQIIACPTDRGSRAAPIQDQSSRTMIVVLRAVDVERQVRIGQAGATCKDELYDELRVAVQAGSTLPWSTRGSSHCRWG